MQRIAAGEDPSILDDALARLRDHDVTRKTLDLARSWTQGAIDELDVLPKGPVREALTRFAQSLADRSS